VCSLYQYDDSDDEVRYHEQDTKPDVPLSSASCTLPVMVYIQPLISY
jgi:hypothetical protein